jgi:hypothetical protein
MLSSPLVGFWGGLLWTSLKLMLTIVRREVVEIGCGGVLHGLWEWGRVVERDEALKE